MMLRIKRALSAAVTAALVVPAASAGTIHYTDLTTGASSSLIHSVDTAASVFGAGGLFTQKTVAGHTAAGISSGSVHGEIDGEQSISFAFDGPVSVTSLSISFLYSAGNYGDMWNEVASFSTDIGSFELAATGATTGSWNGFGTLVNDSPAVQGHAGRWTISGDDIFGGPITSLELVSGNPGDKARYGDYSFYRLTYQAVPAPGALALLLLAGGVGARRRRRL